jgi:hypothetical protein
MLGVVLVVLMILVLALLWIISKLSAAISEAISELHIAKSMYTGSRWLYLADFHSDKFAHQQPASAYPTLASSVKTVFPLFCPKERVISVNMDARSQHKIHSAVISSGPFQRAHLMPCSHSCNFAYKALFEPMIESAVSSSPYSYEQMFDFLFNGFRKNIDANRVDHSGIVHNWFNIVGLPYQHEGLDLKTLIALIPLTIGGKPVTIRDILEWNGQEMSALILPHTAKDGREYFRFTDTIEDEKFVTEIDSKDPTVGNAVHVFNQFLLQINSYLAQYDVDKDREGTNKLVVCQLYREFCRVVSRKIPCLENPLCKTKFLKVQIFPARRILSPRLSRKRALRSTASIGSDGSLGDFSAPHPFLLLLRATNAWLDYLHANDMWFEWSTYLQNRLAEDKRLQKRRKPMDKARLVLLPSCCDFSVYEPDCIICKTEQLIAWPEVYPDLTDDLLYLAKMFVFTQATLTEEQCKQILMLKADPRRRCRQAKL